MTLHRTPLLAYILKKDVDTILSGDEHHCGIAPSTQTSRHVR